MRKKFLALTMVLACSTMLFGCGSDDSKKEASDDATTVAETTAEETTTEAETTTEEATTVNSGTVTVGDISVELTDGWYVNEATDTDLELKKESLGDFPEIDVEYHEIYTEGDGAEAWAEKINQNYGGGHKITTTKINGIKYWVLDATDDGQQTLYFADIDEKHYAEIDCMFFDNKEAQKQLKKISINK